MALSPVAVIGAIYTASERGLSADVLAARALGLAPLPLCTSIVVASGGGWSAVPGRLGELSAATVSVWLRVSAEEAVRRARNQPRSRPLLGATDALGAVRELLRLRTPLYAEAEHEVDTESSSVEDVSIRVLELLGLNDPIADTE